MTRDIRRPPGLAVILVGNRPDSLLYVTRKQEACQRVGIRAEIHRLRVDVSQQALQDEVRRVCADPAVDGVLVQVGWVAGRRMPACEERLLCFSMFLAIKQWNLLR